MTATELRELQAEWDAIDTNTSANEYGRVDLRTLKKIAATVRKCLYITEPVSMKSLPQFIIRIAQLSASEHNTIDDIVLSVGGLETKIDNVKTDTTEIKDLLNFTDSEDDESIIGEITGGE